MYANTNSVEAKFSSLKIFPSSCKDDAILKSPQCDSQLNRIQFNFKQDGFIILLILYSMPEWGLSYFLKKLFLK